VRELVRGGPTEPKPPEDVRRQDSATEQVRESVVEERPMEPLHGVEREAHGVQTGRRLAPILRLAQRGPGGLLELVDQAIQLLHLGRIEGLELSLEEAAGQPAQDVGAPDVLVAYGARRWQARLPPRQPWQAHARNPPREAEEAAHRRVAHGLVVLEPVLDKVADGVGVAGALLAPLLLPARTYAAVAPRVLPVRRVVEDARPQPLPPLAVKAAVVSRLEGTHASAKRQAAGVKGALATDADGRAALPALRGRPRNLESRRGQERHAKAQDCRQTDPSD
jgi:hypothetical protein